MPKYPIAFKQHILLLLASGRADYEVSKEFEISTKTLRRWRKEYDLSPSEGGKSRYSDEQLAEAIELIKQEFTIGEISEKTGVNNQKIHDLYDQEISKGTQLPELKRGVARRTKYSDLEVIELAFLNPGYGFNRFIKFLKIARNHTIDLFLELKEFNGDDPYGSLQDSSNHELVSFEEYKQITGKDPRLMIKSGGGKGRRGGDIENINKLRKVYLPPQQFNWGEIIRNDEH